ncbi:lipopolysaccharide biosynthesis protein [Meiothermus rufus]|uniref:lipopolysaccharide biosynthesis protein n=1 Tax=Meiothermus rufus TaxID=604332 RepID=UPI0004135AA7|nr:lipopolysaccharide biosynthesis protein [Meiothermus rufus]
MLDKLPKPGRRFTQQAGWALIDQALYGVSNFLANTLMARWLEPAEYGAFAVGWLVLLIGFQVQNPLITEPLAVYTPSRFRLAPHIYQQQVVQLHWLLTGLASLVFLVLAWLQTDTAFRGVYLGLAVALPFVQYGMLARRICYANLVPKLSALGGLIYLPLFVLSTLALQQVSWLNALTAMTLMGLASLVSGHWVIFLWKRGSSPELTPSPLRQFTAWFSLFRMVLRYHWRYGRWGLPASLLWVVVSSLPYLLLLRTHSLEAVAELRVLENTIAPVNSFLSAFNSLMLPAFARASSLAALDRMVWRYALFFCGISTIVWIGMTWLHDPIFVLLYGTNYRNISHYLPWFALVPLFTWLGEVFFSAFRALEQPRWIAWLYAIASISMAVLGGFLIKRFELHGAVLSILFIQILLAAMALALWLSFGRHARR